MFVSETVEETKHIPTLPHAQKSLQKLGDSWSWSIPWACQGEAWKVFTVLLLLLTFLSASSLSNIFHLGEFSLIFLHGNPPPSV